MRVALMSFAHPHATSYARVLRSMPGVEVLASDPGHVARPPGESGGPELAAQLGIGYVDGYPDLLAWGPDAVVVCAENARHRELVERAARAGAHVLCEKPLATTRADARAMISACAAGRVSLMVAYPVRFSPAFRALRSAYTAGALGEVAAVTGTNNGRLPVGSRSWFVDPELSGGGSLMDHTVHLADLVDSLFGGVRPVSVYAATNRLLHADRVSVETGGLVSIRYANDVVATFDCSWSRPDASPTWGGLTLAVVATQGLSEIDAFGTRVDGQTASGRQLWLPYGADTDAMLITEFVNAIAEDRRPQPDGEAGYRSLEIALAGYASVRTGQPVEL